MKMNKTIIVSSFFAIMLFVAAANAQQLHLKTINPVQLSSAATIYRNVNGTWMKLSSDVVVGPSVLAGQTVRLRIATTNNRGMLIVGVDTAKRSVGTATGKLYAATEVG